MPTRIAAVILILCPALLGAQQVVDSSFRPRIGQPAYAAGAGPRVLVDAGHNSPRSIDTNFKPFADLLLADGYRVTTSTAPMWTRDVLARADILVVINALAARNVGNHVLPTPSAFTEQEITLVLDWVHRGGALLLVADHMPFAGAAAALARVLGIEVSNGFAIDTVRWNPLVFRRANGTLATHPITNGRTSAERIDSIATFDGHAFRIVDGSAHALYTFSGGVISYLPDTAWQFSGRTPSPLVDGWHQGAALVHGTGRVVMLGEAAMLSAQFAGAERTPMGMNHPWAGQNGQFVLNVMHWLGGLLPR